MNKSKQQIAEETAEETGNDLKPTVLNFSCQEELSGKQIHIRKKRDDGGYWKAFIIGGDKICGDLSGYGQTPVAALLSVVQQLANLPYQKSVFQILDEEENRSPEVTSTSGVGASSKESVPPLP